MLFGLAFTPMLLHVPKQYLEPPLRWHTVDGSEIPNNQLGCKNTLQIIGINYQPQLVSRIFSINSNIRQKQAHAPNISKHVKCWPSISLLRDPCPKKNQTANVYNMWRYIKQWLVRGFAPPRVFPWLKKIITRRYALNRFLKKLKSTV